MNYRLLIILSFICIMFSDAISYISAAFHMNIDAGSINGILKVISFSCLIFLIYKMKWRTQMPPWTLVFFKLLIGWNLVTILRGFFSARDYWDWKYLILETSFSLLIPFTIIVALMYEYSKNLFTLIVTKIFLFGFIIIPLTYKLDAQRELYPRGIVIYACFFILLIPYFKTKWQLLTLLVAAISIYLSPDFRSNIIRIVIALLILSFYYGRKYVHPNVLKTISLVFFFLPLLLLFLGVTKVYNVFKPTDDIEKYDYSYDNGEEKNMAEDTRTFLYQEVFASMYANDTFVFGEGGTGKYRTEYFDDAGTDSKGRTGTEVGFLNILLYAGIVGVLLYALVLFSAVYYGIRYSNNFLCKMLAVFLAFRWVFFFVEDFTGYDMNYYFLWLAVGLCFSKRFRALSDNDITEFFNFQIPVPAAWAF